MLQSIIVKVIQQKNPVFTLDPAVSSSMLFSMVFQKANSWFRAFKTLWGGKFYPTLFLGKNVHLDYLNNILFGKWNQLEDYVQLSALGSGSLRLGDNVKIGAFSRLIISTSFNDLGLFIHIGDNVGIGEFAYLGGAGGLEIGNDCIIGQYFSCHPENHYYQNTNQLIRHQGVIRKGIKIGNNCWIGSKVTILDGVTIGDNCVIAAGAVVTKSMPANSVIGGLPAKVIKPIGCSTKQNEYSLNGFPLDLLRTGKFTKN